MSLPVRLRPQVTDEVNAIRAYLDTQQAGLGDDFYNEFLRFLDRIEANPYLYGAVRKAVRAGPVHRFSYFA